MATRPSLRVLPGGPAADGMRFCGRCGHPPAPGTMRVCRRCGDGIVLCASTGGAPSPDGAFLVVDQELVVRAVSMAAEVRLGVAQDDAVGLPLARVVGGEEHLQHLQLVPCDSPPALLVVLGAAAPSPA